MNKKISIVVPVYNVENYIDKCLDSLVHQTIDNYEIIIVIDGSKDGSSEIVKRYKQNYPQLITYYETENHGLSAARNYGLERTNGEYIGFVDSDDYVDITMFEKLYNCAKKNDCDIVVCDYYKITDKGNKHKDINIKENENREDIVIKSKPYAWNKIYKKEVFEKYNIKFPEGLIFEDVCSIYPLLIQVDKIGYVNEPLYNYIFNRSDSIMKSKKLDCNAMIKVLKKLNNYCKKNNLFKQNYNLLCELNVRHIFYRIKSMKKYGNSKLYNMGFVFRALMMLNIAFPQWRKQSKYASEISKKKKSIIYIQYRILFKNSKF